MISRLRLGLAERIELTLAYYLYSVKNEDFDFSSCFQDDKGIRLGRIGSIQRDRQQLLIVIVAVNVFSTPTFAVSHQVKLLIKKWVERMGDANFLFQLVHKGCI